MGSLFDGNNTSESDNAFVEIQSGDQSGDVADVTSEKRLKVDAEISDQSYPNTLVIEEMNASTGGVNRSTTLPSSFTPIYSYSGSGLFFGTYINFNNDGNIWLRITVDGSYVFFGSNGLNIDDFDISGDMELEDIDGSFLDIGMKNNSIRVGYQTPIRFQTSCVIEARSTSNYQFKAGFVKILKG